MDRAHAVDLRLRLAVVPGFQAPQVDVQPSGRCVRGAHGVVRVGRRQSPRVPQRAVLRVPLHLDAVHGATRVAHPAYPGLAALHGYAAPLAALGPDSQLPVPPCTRRTVAAADSIVGVLVCGWVLWVVLSIVGIPEDRLYQRRPNPITSIIWFNDHIGFMLTYMCPAIAVTVGVFPYVIQMQLHYMQSAALDRAVRSLSAAYDPRRARNSTRGAMASASREDWAARARQDARELIEHSRVSRTLFASMSASSASLGSTSGDESPGGRAESSNELASPVASVAAARARGAPILAIPPTPQRKATSSLEDGHVFSATTATARQPPSSPSFSLIDQASPDGV